MEKRYQVFISSTFQDLQNARQEVSQALLRADCFPAGMELFPAADEEQFAFIKTVIDQSDYYIIISAGRYGSIHPETGLSYTEMEYDYAVEIGKPVICLLHARPFYVHSGFEIDRDPASKKMLQRFRTRVSELGVVYSWENISDLGEIVARAITRLKAENPRAGWIRDYNNSLMRAEREIQSLRGLNNRYRESQTRKLSAGVQRDLFDLKIPRRVLTNSVREESFQLSSITLGFPGKQKRLSEWLWSALGPDALGWEVVAGRDAIDHLEFVFAEVRDLNDRQRAISKSLDILDRDGGLAYFGSINELPSKQIAPAESIKAIALLDGRTYRLGIIRIGFSIIIFTASAGVGLGIARTATGVGTALEQVLDQLGGVLAEQIRVEAHKEGDDLGMVSNNADDGPS